MPLFGIITAAQSIPRGVDGVAGAIIIPSRRTYESASKRAFRKDPYRKRLLLDPQLYLTDLDPSRCKARCASLSTYGWFETGLLEFQKTNSSRTSTKWRDKSRKIIKDFWSGSLPTGTDIDDAARSVVATQQLLGCEAIILAAPLTNNSNTDLELELEWLERGQMAAKKGNMLRLPVYASVAAPDRLFEGIDPFENPLIDTIVDQISARQPDGVYIVLELNNETGYYMGSPQVLGSLLRMVDGFKRAGVSRIIVNYATVAGLLAVAAGADTLSTGWYKSERVLNVGKLGDEDRGAAYPSYYSHQLASEINVGDDLVRIVRAKKLSLFEDRTPFSSGLLQALSRGKTPADVPDWAYLQTNHANARGHFMTALGRETAALERLDPEAKLRYGTKWLASATRLADELTALAEDGPALHDRTEVSHQDSWQKAFAAFLKKRNE